MPWKLNVGQGIILSSYVLFLQRLYTVFFGYSINPVMKEDVSEIQSIAEKVADDSCCLIKAHVSLWSLVTTVPSNSLCL